MPPYHSKSHRRAVTLRVFGFALNFSTPQCRSRFLSFFLSSPGDTDRSTPYFVAIEKKPNAIRCKAWLMQKRRVNNTIHLMFGKGGAAPCSGEPRRVQKPHLKQLGMKNKYPFARVECNHPTGGGNEWVGSS